MIKRCIVAALYLLSAIVVFAFAFGSRVDGSWQAVAVNEYFLSPPVDPPMSLPQPIDRLRDFRVEANWNKLQKQMTSQEVVALLGYPIRQTGQRESSIRAGESSGTDYYEGPTDTFGRVSGMVTFDDNDLVTGWDNPIFIPLLAAGSGDFRVEANWDKLQKQMTSKHVEVLLGTPTIPNAAGDYLYEAQSETFRRLVGTVVFGGTDRVTGWDKPSFIPLSAAGLGDFRVEANWDMLQDKMTRQDVEVLLGTPTIPNSSGDYLYEGQTDTFGVVRGRVVFSGTDRVTEWTKPSFISVPD